MYAFCDRLTVVRAMGDQYRAQLADYIKRTPLSHYEPVPDTRRGRRGSYGLKPMRTFSLNRTNNNAARTAEMMFRQTDLGDRVQLASTLCESLDRSTEPTRGDNLHQVQNSEVHWLSGEALGSPSAASHSRASTPETSKRLTTVLNRINDEEFTRTLQRIQEAINRFDIREVVPTHTPEFASSFIPRLSDYGPTVSGLQLTRRQKARRRLWLGLEDELKTKTRSVPLNSGAFPSILTGEALRLMLKRWKSTTFVRQ